MEVIESSSVLGVSEFAEALAVALVARQGDRESCQVSRGKLARELAAAPARVTFGLGELERARWITITPRSGYPSSFDVAASVRNLLAQKAKAHRDAFSVEAPRMSARDALCIAQRAGCRLYLDEHHRACVGGPTEAMLGVIARLRKADVNESLTAWLEEFDLGDTRVVYAAMRLLEP